MKMSIIHFVGTDGRAACGAENRPVMSGLRKTTNRDVVNCKTCTKKMTKMVIVDFTSLTIGQTFMLPNDLNGKTGRGVVVCTKVADDAYTEQNNGPRCITFNPRVVIR